MNSPIVSSGLKLLWSSDKSVHRNGLSLISVITSSSSLVELPLPTHHHHHHAATLQMFHLSPRINLSPWGQKMEEALQSQRTPLPGQTL